MIGIVTITIISILYYLSRLYSPLLTQTNLNILKSNYSLLSTLIISLMSFVYLSIHSLYLIKKKLFPLNIIEFILSIFIYIAGFLLISHDGGYLGIILLPFASVFLILYLVIWTIFYFIYKKN